ncbi:MAG TPA: DUF6790 family protein [Arachnia sp.]|nr:DUF6790 family protein [Arachnia sp.]
MEAFFEIPGLNVYLQIAVTIISIGVHLIRTRTKDRKETVIEIVTIYTIGLAGWFTIMSGLFGHIIYADSVASSIGWPVNSGFQMELGFASIGMGIVGFLGFWRKAFWLPFIIVKSVFMWGAGFTHILHAVQQDNLSPGNVGVIIYWDFLFPLVMIALYVLDRRTPGGASTSGRAGGGVKGG